MKKHKTLNLIGKIFSTILIVILVGIAALTLLSVLGIPKNAQIFAVETGSMEPNLPTGSLVFVSPQDAYQVGDIITYKSNLGNGAAPKNYNVTHRITNISNINGDTFFETKGDANAGPDPWTANQLDVLGKVNNHIPYVGYIIAFAKTKLGFVFLLLLPAILIIFLEFLNISRAINENAKRAAERKFTQSWQV